MPVNVPVQVLHSGEPFKLPVAGNLQRRNFDAWHGNMRCANVADENAWRNLYSASMLWWTGRGESVAKNPKRPMPCPAWDSICVAEVAAQNG